jgi:hypothetical protein
VIAGLAQELSTMNDQGVGKKTVRLTSAQIADMKAGDERMRELLREYGERNVAPQYEVLRHVYLNENLIEPTYRDTDRRMKRTNILWMGVPNEAMKPVNAAAEAVYAQFIRSIAGTTRYNERPIEIDYSRRDGGLKVLNHSNIDNGTPHMRMPSDDFSGGLQVLNARVAGDLENINVLGTIHPAARQHVA